MHRGARTHALGDLIHWRTSSLVGLALSLTSAMSFVAFATWFGLHEQRRWQDSFSLRLYERSGAQMQTGCLGARSSRCRTVSHALALQSYPIADGSLDGRRAANRARTSEMLGCPSGPRAEVAMKNCTNICTRLRRMSCALFRSRLQATSSSPWSASLRTSEMVAPRARARTGRENCTKIARRLQCISSCKFS